MFCIASSAPLSSSSVEILVFRLCFFGMIIINPRPFLPIGIAPPVCPCMFPYAPYDASTHQFSTFTSLSRRISGSLIVIFKYASNLRNFFQSSLSGFRTHIIRNAIAVCASFLHQIPVKINCANTWWNTCACVLSSSSRLFYSLMVNIFAAAGVSGDSIISSIKSSSTPLRYSHVDIQTSPGTK